MSERWQSQCRMAWFDFDTFAQEVHDHEHDITTHRHRCGLPWHHAGKHRCVWCHLDSP